MKHRRKLFVLQILLLSLLPGFSLIAQDEMTTATLAQSDITTSSMALAEATTTALAQDEMTTAALAQSDITTSTMALAEATTAALAQDEMPDTTTTELLTLRKRESTQVRIHAKVLEWTTDLSDEYGFRVFYNRSADSGNILQSADMTYPMSSMTEFGARAFLDRMSAGSGSFDAMIECLEQFGSVEVLSEPSIICPVVTDAPKEEPYQARITTGARMPFEKAQSVGNSIVQVTDFRDVGVTLNVGVRKIIDDRYIQLVVMVNVKNLAGYISVGTNQSGNPMLVPQLTSREITNLLLAENEKTMITGLLVTESKTQSSSGVPWLSKIPIITHFLGNKLKIQKRQELVFLLRPEIIYD